MKNKLAFLLIAVILLSGASSSAAAYGPQTKTSHCASNNVLPDPACTLGAVLTNGTNIICTPGYTKTVRDVPLSEKKLVFKEYGIPYALHSNYEVDHLISLELGGSNDISNLWPESSRIKSGSLVKDQFENYLHKQVCAGKITIQEAQQEISANWLAYDQLRKNSKPITPAIPIALPPASNTTNTQIQPPPPVPVAPLTTDSNQPAVKKSKAGLCHENGTTYYSRTTKFTSYNSLMDCLNSGGKLPAK